MVQTVFLVSVLGGVVSLVAAVATARTHWRTDAEPFGRRTRAFSVLARPVSCVVASAIPLVRSLTVLGCGLLAIALLCLAYQAVVDFGRP